MFSQNKFDNLSFQFIIFCLEFSNNLVALGNFMSSPSF